MKLSDSIVNVKPREVAGATSAARFDFQRDYSLCTILDCHKKGNDYLILFDYHEDLIIMDSESDPQKISFYQIKGSKSSNWTTERLIKSEKGKDGNPLLSIIGKLYDCKNKFDIETESLNFVSNSRFNIKLADGSNASTKDETCIVEITTDDKKKIKDKLIAELSLTKDPVFENITFLKVTELSLSDSKTHATGKLAEFLLSLNPKGKFIVPALYKNLIDEVRRRTAYNKEIKTFSELVEKKGIGKSLLDKWLTEVAVFKNFDELWSRIEGRLNVEQVSFTSVKKLRDAWIEYELQSKNPNNDVIRKMKSGIVSAHHTIPADQMDNLKLTEWLEKIVNKYNEAPVNQGVYDSNFLKAIALAELYE